MWRPCTSVLDEPAKIWVFGLDDLGLFLGLLIGTGLVLDTLWSLGLAAAVTGGIYLAKRGKPPGTILHRLHTWLYPFFRLPGVLPPHSTTYDIW